LELADFELLVLVRPLLVALATAVDDALLLLAASWRKFMLILNGDLCGRL
jgi:hypothetical protein